MPDKFKLEDDSPMPFGQHAGKPMEDVPASYLHWFWHNGNANNHSGALVMAYIEENLMALKKENKDLIWSKK